MPPRSVHFRMRGTLRSIRGDLILESPSSEDNQPPNTMDAEETYQHIFFYFTLALRSLATMEPATQCDANGSRIVGHELQNEILSGRYVIGKGKLEESEEADIEALAAAVGAVPNSALTFKNGMQHPAWAPIRAQATLLLARLAPRISENKGYFEHS
jgi:hypothetical protein